MASVDLRLGTAGDTRFVAEQMLRASGGLFEQLLDDIMPGIGAEPLLGLALAINQADSAFGCDNAIVAERDSHRCGMALCFPASDYRLPEAVTAIVPSQRLARIEALIDSCPRDSFYLHSLAVLPRAERTGVARRLIHAVAELAAAQGLLRISLHVWQGNEAAVGLYRSLGFKTGRALAIEATPRLRWAGPVVPMETGTADLLARFAEPRRVSA